MSRRSLDSEIVDVDCPACVVLVLRDADRIADLGLHAQAHPLKHGNDLGQVERRVAMVDLHPADIGLEVRTPYAGAQSLSGRQGRHGDEISETLLRLEGFLVGGGKVGVHDQRLINAGRARDTGECVFPRFEKLAQLQVECVFVRLGVAAVDADDQVHACERTFAE